jgi:hypothetical protein
MPEPGTAAPVVEEPTLFDVGLDDPGEAVIESDGDGRSRVRRLCDTPTGSDA